MVPPDTGASIHPMPLAIFSRAAMARAASGWIEEKSTTSLPVPATVARPSGPNTTPSTAAASVRHMKMMLAVSATSRGWPAVFAPASTRAAAFPGDRFQTVTSWPAFTRRRDIGNPIMPSPR